MAPTYDSRFVFSGLYIFLILFLGFSLELHRCGSEEDWKDGH